MAARISGLGSPLRGDYYQRKDRPDSIEYWTRHNVTVHHPFTSVEDSLNQLQFRNQQYPGYIDLLPVSGKDGMAILDYGCGPGHDLVGFAHYSRPKRLVGVDISPSSLGEAEERLKLHHAQAELVRVDYGAYDLPFDAASFDYIHCSGVLMCIEEPARLLREFQRLLKPTGELRLMVYNYDFISASSRCGLRSANRDGSVFRSGSQSRFQAHDRWRGLSSKRGLAARGDAGAWPGNGIPAEFLGSAVSLWELHLLPRWHIACLQPALPRESRTFLMSLRIDAQGHPWHGDRRAGIDGCFRFVRSN